MNYTFRSLTYTITEEKMDKIDEREEYIDLVTIAGLFNAIWVARERDASYQLASFSMDNVHHDELRETVYLTGGLLFDAFCQIELMIDRYKGKAFFIELNDIIEGLRDYKLPEVLLEMRNAGPFHLSTDNRDFTFGASQKMHMFPMFTVMDKGFPVAVVADESEAMENYKRGLETETHGSLKSIVDFLVDEFTLGAQEFLFALAKQLGLKPVEQLKLAA